MPNAITPQVLTSGESLILRTGAPVLRISRSAAFRVAAAGASGTYTVSWKGGTTAPLPLGTTAAQLQAALQALSQVGAGNCTVTGTPGRFILAAAGSLASAPQPAPTVDTSGLSATASAFGTTPGTTGAFGAEDGSSRWDSSGNWSTEGFGSGSGHHEFAAQGAGDNWASWAIPGIASGFYQAMLTWSAGAKDPSVFSPAATFRLYDGPTYLGRFTFDQRKPARTDMVAYGLTGLGPAYVTSGVLTVCLDDATTGVLNADVVYVAPADPAAVRTADDIGGEYAGAWGQVSGYPAVAHDSVVDGSTGQSATLTAACLARATYALETTWNPAGNRSAQVLYRVYDGDSTTPLLSVTVDQTAAPAGGTTRSGHTFFPLGTAACRSGRLRVVVTAADSATKSVQADDVVATPSGPLGFTESVSSSVGTLNPGGDPSYAVGGGAPATLGPPVWYDPSGGDPSRALPYVIYPLPAKVAGGASVAVTVPQGMLVTSSGPTDAADALAATNLSGVTMFPALASVKTLKGGYNITTPNVTTSVDYANYMKGGQDWGGDLDRVTLNANGYPAFSAAGVVSCQVRSGYFNRADPRGFPSHGTTTLTLVWDGPGLLYLSPNAGTLLTQLTSDTGHATNNTRTYSLAPDTSVHPTPYGSGFACVVPATAAGTPATYIGIFDATVADPLNPPKFHPYFLRMLAGAKSIRFAFSLGTNSSSITEWADYPTQTQRSYAAFDQRRKVYTILTIGPFADARGWFPAGDVAMLVTLDRPHGLSSGTSCSFQPPQTGPEPGQIKVHAADGGYAEFEGYNLIAWYDPALMTTGQVAVSSQKGGGTAGVSSPVSPTYTYGGTVQVATNATPVQDAIDLCNAVGVDVAWLNVPPAASDALLAQFGAACLGLNTGIKIGIEVSNEHWNYAAGFSQFFYYRGLGLATGTSPTGAYAAVSAHAHAAVAAALGSRATDLRRIFGTAAVVPALTSVIVSQCQSHSWPLDAIAPAPYTAVFPTRDARLGAVTAAMTVGQCHDVLDAFLLTDYHVATYLTPHWDLVHAAFPSAEVWDYEGGISGAGMDTDDNVYAKQSEGVWQHPRFYQSYQYYLDSVQRGHSTLHNHYGLSNVFIDEVVPSAIYGAYQSWDMRPFVNDGTQPAPYDPRPDLAGAPPGVADMSRSSSNVGAAIKTWNAGVSSPVDPGGGVTPGRAPGGATGSASFESSLFGSILIVGP